jgi:hypothetical protein
MMPSTWSPPKTGPADGHDVDRKIADGEIAEGQAVRLAEVEPGLLSASEGPRLRAEKGQPVFLGEVSVDDELGSARVDKKIRLFPAVEPDCDYGKWVGNDEF